MYPSRLLNKPGPTQSPFQRARHHRKSLLPTPNRIFPRPEKVNGYRRGSTRNVLFPASIRDRGEATGNHCSRNGHTTQPRRHDRRRPPHCLTTATHHRANPVPLKHSDSPSQSGHEPASHHADEPSEKAWTPLLDEH